MELVAEQSKPLEQKPILGAAGVMIEVCDEPAFGAHHLYRVSACDAIGDLVGGQGRLARIEFQKGPIKEAGVNGCNEMDLLAIVSHRLQCFQDTEFACQENEQALEGVKVAMAALHSRTKSRMARGVEGTSLQ